jgi:signal transduction histidine kinase/CheY-like chemotaxis protein
MMDVRIRRAFWKTMLRYGGSVGFVAIAVALTILMWQAGLSRNPYALFFAAVMLSAWLGGLGPGLLATLLAVSAIDYFFMPVFLGGVASGGDLLHMVVFGLVAVLISSLTGRAQRSLEEASAANKAKDHFIAVLSHELRTPLTPALAALSDMEKDPGFSEPIRDDLRLIRRNLELEARLIDDLLDVTRIRRGKLDLNRRVIDLHVLIEEVVEVFCRHDLEHKNLRLELDLSARQSCVNVDAARMQQVLWNLLRNAVKFTPPGGTITIRSRTDGEAIRVQVIDTGIGMQPQVLPRIFQAFEQISTTNHAQGGLGLGLTISRALVEAHGGNLTAHSDGPATGSTFDVELPTAPRDQIWPELNSNTLPLEQPPLRLLLVEDHADTALILARLLRGCNYEVRTASNVSEALRRAEEGNYDLVISDLGLPDGSGLELMQQLQQRHQLRGIAVSGYGREEDVRRSREAGFAAHVTKPIDFPSLQQTIQRVAAITIPRPLEPAAR